MDETDPVRPSESQKREFREARREVGLSQAELWARYFALGGGATPDELEAVVEGASTLGAHEHDVLVHALNERSIELGSSRRWPYSED
jgi:hypothetical protein